MDPEYGKGIEDTEVYSNSSEEQCDSQILVTVYEEIANVARDTTEDLETVFFVTTPQQFRPKHEEVQPTITINEEEIMRISKSAVFPRSLQDLWKKFQNESTDNLDINNLIDSLWKNEPPHIVQIAYELVITESIQKEFLLAPDTRWQQFLHPEYGTKIQLIYGYHIYMVQGLEEEDQERLVSLAQRVLEGREEQDPITVSFAERIFCALSDDEEMIKAILQKHALSSPSYELALKICALRQLPVTFAMTVSKDVRNAFAIQNIPPYQLAFAQRRCIERLCSEIIGISESNGDTEQNERSSFAGLDEIEDPDVDWRGGPSTSEEWKNSTSEADLVGRESAWKEDEAKAHDQIPEIDMGKISEGEFDFLLRFCAELRNGQKNSGDLDGAPEHVLLALEALELWHHMRQSPQYGYEKAMASRHIMELAEELGASSDRLLNILNIALTYTRSVDSDHYRFGSAQVLAKILRNDKSEILGLE